MLSHAMRIKAANILENSDDNTDESRWINIFLISLISLNILAIILESVPSISAQYRTAFIAFEIFSVTVFTIEYLTRIWCIPDTPEYKDSTSPTWRIRLSYVLSIQALIDLIAILPFFLAMFTTVDLRFLRAFRLLRIFKLTRYSNAMQLLLSVFKEEKQSLFAGFFVLFIILITASSGMYLIEHEAQPDKFGSIPDSMWWAMATLTTVGYGDVTPITPLGKLFGGIITIASMGMVALPAGLLASGFSEQVQRRRQKYKLMIKHALADGKITDEELRELQSLRESLGIDSEEAELLMELAFKKSGKLPTHCHHCGHKLNYNSDHEH